MGVCIETGSHVAERVTATASMWRGDTTVLIIQICNGCLVVVTSVGRATVGSVLKI